MAEESKNEYLLGTPDTGMTLLCSGWEGTNPCGILQTFSADMYKLVSDRSKPESKWLPTIIPDGD